MSDKKARVAGLLTKAREAVGAYLALPNYRKLDHHPRMLEELDPNYNGPSKAGLVALIQPAIKHDLHAKIDEPEDHKYFWKEFLRTATDRKPVYPADSPTLAEHEVRFAVVEALVNLAMAQQPEAFNGNRKHRWRTARNLNRTLRIEVMASPLPQDALKEKLADIASATRYAFIAYANSLDTVYHRAGIR